MTWGHVSLIGDEQSPNMAICLLHLSLPHPMLYYYIIIKVPTSKTKIFLIFRQSLPYIDFIGFIDILFFSLASLSKKVLYILICSPSFRSPRQNVITNLKRAPSRWTIYRKSKYINQEKIEKVSFTNSMQGGLVEVCFTDKRNIHWLCIKNCSLLIQEELWKHVVA